MWRKRRKHLPDDKAGFQSLNEPTLCIPRVGSQLPVTARDVIFGWNKLNQEPFRRERFQARDDLFKREYSSPNQVMCRIKTQNHFRAKSLCSRLEPVICHTTSWCRKAKIHHNRVDVAITGTRVFVDMAHHFRNHVRGNHLSAK